MRVAERLRRLAVAPGTVAGTWLGQAGYLFKTAAGTTVMVDPYLSDVCAAKFGLRRQFPAPLTSEEFQPDLLLVTHSHDDHLDEPTVRAYGSAGRTLLIAPPSCTARARDWGWPRSRLTTLKPGESADQLGLRITATFARHPADDALGLLMSVDGIMLWHSGDTEYDEHLRTLAGQALDIAFICINGGGGNMNAHEAALLAWQLKPRVSVPMHYGMWPGAGYRYGGEAPDATPDPALFAATLRKLDPRARVRRLQVGRLVRLV